MLALVLFGSLRYTRARMQPGLLRAVLAGLGVVCVIGLISRVLPHAWPTTGSFFADRLNYPLTYWNAEGMVAAMGLILGFHLTADPERALERACRSAATLLPALARHAAADLLARRARSRPAVGFVAYCLLTRLHTLPTTLVATVPATAVALQIGLGRDALAT